MDFKNKRKSQYSCKWKTTGIFHMKDDLNILVNGRQPLEIN
jgi:hypothetical protein